MEKNLKKGSRKYLAALIVLFIGLMLISCSTQVVLPGLCYDDTTGTYLCPEQIPEIKRDLDDMEEFEPIYEACEEWESHDGETWMQCIMNEQRRRELIKRMA